MRIVSLSPSTTEILFAIGAGDLIVANTYFCDYPEAAKLIPKAGSFSHIEPAKIKSFNPDVIFTSTVVQKRMYEDLKAKGFPVIHFDPRSIKDIIDSIREIGVSTGHSKQSTRIASSMEKEIQKLKKNHATRPRMYIEEWYDPPMYSGNWVPELVELAGGEYFFHTKGDISHRTNEEKLISFDPEYIFVSYCGFGTRSDIHQVLKRKNWQKVTAVKNKKVFALNETILNRPGPRILKSVKEIKKLASLV